jgi:ZIP family zinc transporter
MEFTTTQLLYAFGLTLFAGLSTGIGAALAFFSQAKSYTFLSIGLGFSAGVMIYVSFVEIMVKSQESLTPLYGNTIGELMAFILFFVGIGIAAMIDYLVPQDVNPHQLKSNDDLEVLKEGHGSSLLSKSALRRTGIFTAIAIAIHNFPEGFATFVSALDDVSLGVVIAVAIAIHNIPEGMAVSLPIYHATGDKKSSFWYAFSSGLAEPLGAVIGFFLLLPIMGELTLGITFGIVAGLMIYISLDELLPAARVYGNAHTTILGIVLGMFVMGASLLLFKLI